MSDNSGQGLKVIAPPPETDQSIITVDIIAVPGLGADPKRSFGSETGFNWLSDKENGIRSDIPTARILLYEYDSRWLGGGALPQTLYNAASLFLDSLVAKREGYETRPLVFLAHSMGGLVVAKALTIAVSRPEKIERMRIYECFAGSIFFGSPFRGSSEAARAFLLATFLEKLDKKMPMPKLFKSIPSQMLQCLDPERDSLVELRNDFAQLATKEPRASIACIYELQKQDYVKEKIGQWAPSIGPAEIVVTQESASLDFADEIRGMACNHRNLNRFDSVKDGRYESVRLLLKGIVNKARLIVKRRLAASKHSTVDDGVFARISDSLGIVDFRRKRRNIESVSGNSSWILEEPKYLQWSSKTDESPASRCLWVSGSEGQGKSKAALAVVEALEEEEKKNKTAGARDILVAYFFCDSTPDSRSAENLLKSLMWQLILKRRHLAQYVKGFAAQEKSRSMNNSQESFSLSKLFKGLQEMLRDPSVQDVYFVVNNLHYLSGDETSTKEFLDILQSEILAAPDGAEDPVRDKVRWMFLSRARDNVRHALQSGQSADALRVDLEDGSKNTQLREALKAYTRDRVKTLASSKQYNLALQYFVTSILQKRADNNTLWVEVVCRLLEGLPSNHVQVRKTLEALPQDLNELINRIWAESLNVKTEEIYTTKEILRTLAVAYEDPTINELKVLADLDAGDDATHVREHIKACGPLLRVYDASEFTEDDLGSFRVTFIHPLVKDALLGEKRSRALIGLSEDDDEHTEVRLQHGIIALRCFSYTLGQLQKENNSNPWEQATPSDKEEENPDQELDDLFPENTEPQGDEELDLYALEYPLKYWLRHGNEATPDFVETLDLKHAFWAVDSSARRRWWKTFAKKDGYGELKGLTSMHVAAFFGLTPLIKLLLKDGHRDEIHIRDSWDNQPLHWAAWQGHLVAMETLLSEGADINDGRQEHTWTPLHMAASNGQVAAMKLLLAGTYGATDVNAVAKEDGTALTLALAWNQKQAAELLLSAGASPTLTSNDADPPLALAALRGYEDIVNALIRRGGGANQASQTYGTALAAAASAGHFSIVQTLLQIDGDAKSRQRALLEASGNNFHPIVELILMNTAHVISCDEAFEVAAPQGHDLVLQLLWSRGAVSQDAINTALYLATDNEQESTVKFLLYCGGQPDAGGREQGNAVTAAAYDGNITIINMLIDARADLNCASGYPLQAAAAEGYENVVTLLLNRGAYVNALSALFSDGTALQAACVDGHCEVAKMLLHRGADPNLGAGVFANPLTAAASHGHGDLVELLLQAGANPNVFGDGTTPLINAAATLSARYLETMIRHGADVNMYDPDGDTALIISALFGDDECVELLVKYGANVDFCGQNNGTALQAAASRGQASTCELLLKYGANRSIQGGPHHTALQAAASSGDRDCVKVVLGNDSNGGFHLRDLTFRKDKIDVNAQGGASFTALHAAAAQPDDGCLRLLLARKPNLNVVPQSEPQTGTALQSAILAGCNRNARLLVEAGADPNVSAGKHGSALQAAALKGSVEVCHLLLEHGAKIDGWSGKYSSPLVAAVVRDYHSWDGDVEVLEVLLEQDFSPEAYQAALERAFKLGRKDAFKLIWKSAQAKGPKKLALSTKRLLARFKGQLKQRQPAETEKEDANSDFGDDVDDYDQDFEDEEEEEQKQEEEMSQAAEQTDRGQNGTLTRSWQANGQPQSEGRTQYATSGLAAGTVAGAAAVAVRGNWGDDGEGGFANTSTRGFELEQGEPAEEEEDGGWDDGGEGGFANTSVRGFEWQQGVSAEEEQAEDEPEEEQAEDELEDEQADDEQADDEQADDEQVDED